jgi:hypothetical protein
MTSYTITKQIGKFGSVSLMLAHFRDESYPAIEKVSLAIGTDTTFELIDGIQARALSGAIIAVLNSKKGDIDD